MLNERALQYKGTKGKRARKVPIVEETRPLVAQRILSVGLNPDARLFTGPQGGRISTAVLRDVTHRDDVVTKLGYEHLRRHGLRQADLSALRAPHSLPSPIGMARCPGQGLRTPNGLQK
ncbi:hypothetical protein [Streptomyces cyaneofuscatus]|uniref:hypothetical protein n=1 Tax=Streptomyces cyaneofuscatus TaxID=66883 RepID=UPI0037B27036